MFASFNSDNPIRVECARRDPVAVYKNRAEVSQFLSVMDKLVRNQMIMTNNKDIRDICIQMSLMLNKYSKEHSLK